MDVGYFREEMQGKAVSPKTRHVDIVAVLNKGCQQLDIVKFPFVGHKITHFCTTPPAREPL